MTGNWTAHPQRINDGTVRVFITSRDNAPLKFSEALNLWRGSTAFRRFFTGCILEPGFEAFFWETPPVTTATLDRPFEFALVECAALNKPRPDPRPFAEHFAARPGAGAVSFSNLSGDAVLVAPAPLAADLSCYGHLGRFLREAPAAQAEALWMTTASAVSRRLSSAPLWLSTAGLGVPWLHLRLDSRPKYYRYQPYVTKTLRPEAASMAAPPPVRVPLHAPRAMTVTGIESIRHHIDRTGWFVKCLLTDSAAVFFPGTIQHRDVKRNSVSYEDDYGGNALAATVTPGRIDIRLHRDYTEGRVRAICRELLKRPEMTWAAASAVFYQGRALIL